MFFPVQHCECVCVCVGVGISSQRMWKAAAGQTVNVPVDDDGGDDWETDPDFEVSTPRSPSPCPRCVGLCCSYICMATPPRNAPAPWCCVVRCLSLLALLPEWRDGEGATMGGQDSGRLRASGAHQVRSCCCCCCCCLVALLIGLGHVAKIFHPDIGHTNDNHVYHNIACFITIYDI